MTSKEAMQKLKENFEDDVYYWERKMLDVVDKDLEVLEIIKRSIYNKEEHKYVMNEKLKGKKFILISLSITGDNEIAKVKEWLENDK